MSDIELNEEALEAARKHVEDTLIDMRDSRMSMIAGNGLVVRERDGSDSSIMRLNTHMGLRIGITAYLEALNAAPEVTGDAA